MAAIGIIQRSTAGMVRIPGRGGISRGLRRVQQHHRRQSARWPSSRRSACYLSTRNSSPPARPAQFGRPTQRWHRRSSPSGSAATANAPKPVAASASSGAGPMTPGARHIPLEEIELCARSLGAGGYSPCARIIEEQTEDDEAALVESTRRALPSAEKRSGPASRISIPIAAGWPSTIASTMCAQVYRQDHGRGRQKRTSAERSMSTIVTFRMADAGAHTNGSRPSSVVSTVVPDPARARCRPQSDAEEWSAPASHGGGLSRTDLIRYPGSSAIARRRRVAVMDYSRASDGWRRCSGSNAPFAAWIGWHRAGRQFPTGRPV